MSLRLLLEWNAECVRNHPLQSHIFKILPYNFQGKIEFSQKKSPLSKWFKNKDGNSTGALFCPQIFHEQAPLNPKFHYLQEIL